MLTNINPAKLRLIALVVATPFVVLGVSTFSNDKAQALVSAGPIQHGHEAVECIDCHVPSQGTLRQQIQANVRYAIGLREHPADFAYAKVSSDQCLDCHARENERHPIYRFNEPRFDEVLISLPANSCLGCHSEHADERSFVEIGFCSSCHETLKIKDDPIDVPHSELIADENWDSCMGCHDFHGNHEREVQTKMVNAYPALDIYDYLANGPSPYGDEKIFEGKTK